MTLLTLLSPPVVPLKLLGMTCTAPKPKQALPRDRCSSTPSFQSPFPKEPMDRSPHEVAWQQSFASTLMQELSTTTIVGSSTSYSLAKAIMTLRSKWETKLPSSSSSKSRSQPSLRSPILRTIHRTLSPHPSSLF